MVKISSFWPFIKLWSHHSLYFIFFSFDCKIYHMNCWSKSYLFQILLAWRGEWTQPFFNWSCATTLEELNHILWIGEHDWEPFDIRTPIELKIGGESSGVLCFHVTKWNHLAHGYEFRHHWREVQWQHHHNFGEELCLRQGERDARDWWKWTLSIC